MPSVPAIVLARPEDPGDPMLCRDSGGGWLFPRVLAALREDGLLGATTLALPEDTPAEIREILDTWGLPRLHLASAAPQLRLAGAARRLGLEQTAVLTAYSYLPEADALAGARRALAEGADAAGVHEAPAALCFALVGRRALEALAEMRDGPVSPFAFLARLQETPGLRVAAGCAPGPLEPGVRFLYDLTCRGERSIPPRALLRNFFATAPRAHWFRRGGLESALAAHFGLADPEAFRLGLAAHIAPEELPAIAAQLHFLKGLTPHLPARRGMFVEIGFGRCPATSLLLLNAFERGLCVEPYVEHHSPLGLMAHLSKSLGSLHGLELARTRDEGEMARGLDVRSRRIEELELPDGSVDFCFSKTSLEHVFDVPAMSERLWRMLAPGGAMYHVIDFRDHRDTSAIRFDFLEHSRERWMELNDVTNLWRLSDYVGLWRDMGFAVEVLERRVRVERPARLHPSWSGYAEEDLYCHHAAVLARKPL